MIKLISCLSLLMTISLPVAAFECYQASPTAEALEDEYQNNDNSFSISGDEKELQFLKDLKGKWQGTGEEISCKGTESHPEKISKTMNVEADVIENGIVLFRAKLEKSFPTEGISRSDDIGLINTDSLYSLSVNGRNVEANQREFASNGANAGVRYLEYMIRIQAPSDNNINIEWDMFTNGVYVFTQKLNLTR